MPSRIITSSPISLRSREHIEGICSPLEGPNTPPGILTKTDFIQITRNNSLNSMDYGELRMNCANCHKSLPCICKKCTLERMSFYSKRENISIKTKRRKELDDEIVELLSTKAEIESEVNRLRSSILTFRRQIDIKKKRIQEKKETLEETRIAARKKAKSVEHMAATMSKAEGCTGITRERVLQLREVNRKLHLSRRQLCLLVFGFFPIDTAELAIGDSTIASHPVYSIRGARVCADFLPNPPTRESQAALLHTSLLLTLLSILLDIPLPFRLSPSPEGVEQDWHRLSVCAMWVASQGGVGAPSLSLTSPHPNLIAFFQHLFREGSAIEPREDALASYAAHLTKFYEEQGRLQWCSEWDTLTDA